MNMSPVQYKVLYHGSAELFDKIDVDKGLPRKDFGKGFYMSVSKRQAEGVMRKKYTETINRRPNRSKEGLVKVVYSITVDTSVLEDMDVKVFPDADMEWFEFVLKSRKSEKNIHNYDVVIGPTADDDTRMVIKGLYDGLYGDWWTKAAKQKALEALHPERLGVQWFVFKPQIVKRLVKSMEAERYD